MEARFHVADSNEDWSLFFLSNFLLFNFGETLQNCSLSFRCTPWASRFDVKSIQRRSSAYVGCNECGFFLNYCCFPISSKWSSHSPLTSSINNAFSPRELLLLGFFFLIWTILCKSKRCCEKIRAILEIVRPVHLAQTAIPHSKLVKWPFSAILMVSLNFSRVSWLCPKCINVLSCCHVIGTYITIPYSNKTHTYMCVLNKNCRLNVIEVLPCEYWVWFYTHLPVILGKVSSCKMWYLFSSPNWYSPFPKEMSGEQNKSRYWLFWVNDLTSQSIPVS